MSFRWSVNVLDLAVRAVDIESPATTADAFNGTEHWGVELQPVEFRDGTFHRRSRTGDGKLVAG